MNDTKERFLDAMASEGFFLTILEQDVAGALLAARFSQLDTKRALEASPWIQYYRRCVTEGRLPEGDAIAEGIRAAFDKGVSIDAGVEMAIESLRRAVNGPSQAELAFSATTDGQPTTKAALH